MDGPARRTRSIHSKNDIISFYIVTASESDKDLVMFTNYQFHSNLSLAKITENKVRKIKTTFEKELQSFYPSVACKPSPKVVYFLPPVAVVLRKASKTPRWGELCDTC